MEETKGQWCKVVGISTDEKHHLIPEGAETGNSGILAREIIWKAKIRYTKRVYRIVKEITWTHSQGHFDYLRDNCPVNIHLTVETESVDAIGDTIWVRVKKEKVKEILIMCIVSEVVARLEGHFDPNHNQLLFDKYKDLPKVEWRQITSDDIVYMYKMFNDISSVNNHSHRVKYESNPRRIWTEKYYKEMIGYYFRSFLNKDS